jgi:nucleoside-diphosphate-sugar epimerase
MVGQGKKPMKLLILGAASFTGRELVNLALAQGHAVTAFVRKPEESDQKKGPEDRRAALVAHQEPPELCSEKAPSWPPTIPLASASVVLASAVAPAPTGAQARPA